MKNTKKILLFIISIMLILSSCGKTSNISEKVGETEQQASKATIKDYFPLKENVKMKYQGIGNEYAEHETYVDYIDGDRIQIRDVNPGTTLAKIYEIKDGELRLVLTREEYYYKQNLLYNKTVSYDVLLKEPIEKGTSWTSKDGLKRYISNVDVKVSTPSGEYTAVEVTTEGSDYKILDYYVKDIGLVKSVYKNNSMTIESTLEKIEENVPFTQEVKLYFPDFDSEKIAYKIENIELKTNENIDDVLEKKLKNPPIEKLNKVFTANTKINKLYFNNIQNKVYLDLNQEFISEMNAGSSLEMMILQSLVNTLGDYYKTDKVFISIENKPYESGHIAITEKEFFQVDYSNVYEVKQ